MQTAIAPFRGDSGPASEATGLAAAYNSGGDLTVEHVKETEPLADFLMAADNLLQDVSADDGTVATQNVIELVDRIDVKRTGCKSQ